MEFFIIFLISLFTFHEEKSFLSFAPLKYVEEMTTEKLKSMKLRVSIKNFSRVFFNLCLEKIKKTFFIFILVQIIYTHCLNSISKQQIIP